MRAHPEAICMLAKAEIVVKSPEVRIRPTVNQFLINEVRPVGEDPLGNK